MRTLICIMTTDKEPFLSMSHAIADEYRVTIREKNLDMSVCEYAGGTDLQTLNGIMYLPADDNSTYLKRWKMMEILKSIDTEYDVFVFQGTSSICNLELLNKLIQSDTFDESGIYGSVMTIQNRRLTYDGDNGEGREMLWSGQIMIGCLNIMTKQMMYDILEHMDMQSWPDDIKDKYRLFTNQMMYKCFTRKYSETMATYLPSLDVVDDDIVINAVVLDILHKNIFRINSVFLNEAVNMNVNDYMSLLSVRSKMEEYYARDFSAEWYWNMRMAYEPMFDKMIQKRFRENTLLDQHVRKCKETIKKYPVPIEEVTPENFDIYTKPFVPEFTFVDKLVSE